MSERRITCPIQGPLARRLDFPRIIPACDVELPTHGGRTAEHRIFRGHCDSHSLEQILLPGIHHPLATQDDNPYRLFRAVPRGHAPAEGWPIIYMLDGNAAFDFLTKDMLAQVPGLVVVGIGYDSAGQFDRHSRTRDLTFPADAPDATARPAGGAAQFISLLTGPLRDAAEQGLTINAVRRTLWGHSLGGLFALQMMRLAPGSFARYAAISPSLWRSEEQADALMQDSRIAPDALYLGSGNREKRSFSDGPPPTDAPESFYDLVEAFSIRRGLDLCWQIYDGAVHIASLPTSLEPSLIFAATESPS